MPKETSPNETSRATPRRVRRPKDKDGLLSQLIEEGVFGTLADALAFAAAVGYAQQRKEAFEQSSDAINWSVFAGAGLEALVNMVAAVNTGDFNILGAEHFNDRLIHFEEFANGGLNVIQELLKRSNRPSLDLVVDMIMDAEKVPEGGSGPEIENIARDLSW